jgi:hypothetical protein
MQKVGDPLTADVLGRSINYLYTKEKLIDLQNKIVEGNKQANDYRADEIYVGSTIYLLEDGNGRIHRYLIHDVMKQREPEHKCIIPISAAILKNKKQYDAVLETISRPTLAMLDCELDSENSNKLIVHNDIDYMYRYPDYTAHVKFVYDMMNQAISNELVEQIGLLVVFDAIKGAINDLTDIPNNMLDNITSILINGGGKVSKAKQKLVLSHMDKEKLVLIEQLSANLIQAMKERINIDVQQLMKKA